MSGHATFRALVLAAGLALLVGCATRTSLPARPAPPEPSGGPALADATQAYAAQSAREAQLAALGDWRLRGRIAFAGARDGATVQIDWTQQGEAFVIRLTAPITGRQWQLRGQPGEAELVGLDGGPRRADDAERLLLEATGWRLPVTQFPHWVRGARGPGSAEALAVDAEARPVGWSQAGWHLHFRDWWPGDPPLPRRVFAEREGASVRLVVATWSAPDASGAADMAGEGAP